MVTGVKNPSLWRVIKGFSADCMRGSTPRFVPNADASLIMKHESADPFLGLRLSVSIGGTSEETAHVAKQPLESPDDSKGAPTDSGPAEGAAQR